MAKTNDAPAEALAIPEDVQVELLKLSEEIDVQEQQYEAICEKRLSMKHGIEEKQDAINELLRDVRGAPLMNQKVTPPTDEDTSPLLTNDGE